MRKLILIITVCAFAFSCEADLTNLNQNKKDPTTADAGALFSSAVKQLADEMVTPSTGRNNTRIYAQHLQEVTYISQGNYSPIRFNSTDAVWDAYYRDVLKDLEEARKAVLEDEALLGEGVKENRLAAIKIIKSLAYANLVELFGNVPFSEAIQEDNYLPKYDDAKEVYTSVVDSLDAAITAITPSAVGFDGAQDLIYNGNSEKWRKLANTIKFRMGMVLLDDTVVEDALAGGIFESSEDDAEYQYISASPNWNPIHNNMVASGRDDYVIAQTITDVMNDLNDPRRLRYFDPNIKESLGEVTQVDDSVSGELTLTVTAGDEAPVSGDLIFVEDGTVTPAFVGIVSSVGSNTFTVTQLNTEPSNGDQLIKGVYTGAPIGMQVADYGIRTHVNRSIVEADAPGIILTFAETRFLLAEAAERGFNVAQTADAYYEEGIRASFEKWNVPGVNDYLNNPDVQYDSSNWQEQIAVQAWLSTYNQGYSPYLSVRRLGYPKLNRPDAAEIEYPYRFSYPVGEQKLNDANRKAAAEAMGASQDNGETKLFWQTEDIKWL